MKNCIVAAALLLLFGCAQQTQPTGGPKDEMPPVLIETSPEQGTVNFKGSQVELTFSEAIQLNKPKEEIIISPAVKETETIFRKDKVILKFITPLRDSTTYSLNFREAVQDLTERNPARGVKLAFSTGTYIDSLSVSGTVYDVLSNKPLKDVTVALYPKNDTFSIFKHKATLFTKADAEGKYLLENLKNGLFHVYAFVDKNKNLIVDSRSEKYGFLGNDLLLEKKMDDINIPLISLDARTLKLINAKPLQNYFNIRANKAVESFTVQYANKQPALFAIGEDHATLRVYQPFDVADSIAARVVLRDSLHNTVDTTLYVKFNAPNPELKLDKFNVQTQRPTVLVKTNMFSTKILVSKPLHQIVFDSIFFRIDSATLVSLGAEDLQLDSQKLILSVTKKLPVSQSVSTASSNSSQERAQVKSDPKLLNQLVFGKGAFISIDGDSSNQVTEQANVYKEEDLAITLVEAKTKEKNFYVEIINSKDEVVNTLYNQTKGAFKDLLPGEYTLRLVIDHNANRKWDVGNYFLKQEPELIYYYYDDKGNSKFNLKANWEYGPLLITDQFRVYNPGKSTDKKGASARPPR
jgi:hypothetical protein